jgi:hypothetical protein
MTTIDDPPPAAPDASIERRGHVDAERRRRAGRRRRVVLTLCALAVIAIYARSALSYGKTIAPAHGRADFQNLQADAFLQGQLALAIVVPPGLAALPDPYDATANAPYRAAGLHDLSFFDGKLYTYNGPAPVVLLYIPYRALGLGDLSPALACLIFCSGGFLAFAGAFKHTARALVGRLPLIVEAGAVLALGLAGPMAWIVYVGRGYEASIASGYFMVGVGLLFLTRALFAQLRRVVLDLVLAATFLAGAIAARPSLVWTLGFVVFGAAYAWWGPKAELRRPSSIVALAAPCVVIGVALAWYNWARFGAVGEFGTSYMLLGENVRLARANELGFIPRGLFHYVLSPARIEGGFPWFRLRRLSYPLPFERSYLLEPVAGVLPNMPAVLLGIVAYFITPWRWLRAHGWLSLLVVVCVLDGLLTLVLLSYHFHGATMRYELDFAPPLLFASVLGAATFLQRLRRQPALLLAGVSVAFLVLSWSVFFAMTITTYPCYGVGSC